MITKTKHLFDIYTQDENYHCAGTGILLLHLRYFIKVVSQNEALVLKSREI